MVGVCLGGHGTGHECMGGEGRGLGNGCVHGSSNGRGRAWEQWTGMERVHESSTLEWSACVCVTSLFSCCPVLFLIRPILYSPAGKA